MKKFLINSFLFSLPLVILVSLPCYILVRTGENFYDLDNAIGSFQDRRYLVGYMYNEHNYKYLKHRSFTNRANTNILVLGSSRVLQFREDMFEESFYNAGYTVSNISDFKVFLSALPDTLMPRYLIIGLDQWMFNETWHKLSEPIEREAYRVNNSASIAEGVGHFKNVYEDFVTGKIALEKLEARSEENTGLVGLNAALYKFGFRNDGSLGYGTVINGLLKDHKGTPAMVRNVFGRIEAGNQRFEYGDRLSEPALDSLRELLSYCKSKNIRVTAFIPPYAALVYEKMRITGRYRYVDEIYPQIKPFFDAFGYEVYSYNSVHDCNSDDMELLDGLHGSERMYLRILISMLKQGSRLNEVCRLERLERDLTGSRNRYVVYDN